MTDWAPTFPSPCRGGFLLLYLPLCLSLRILQLRRQGLGTLRSHRGGGISGLQAYGIHQAHVPVCPPCGSAGSEKREKQIRPGALEAICPSKMEASIWASTPTTHLPTTEQKGAGGNHHLHLHTDFPLASAGWSPVLSFQSTHPSTEAVCLTGIDRYPCSITGCRTTCSWGHWVKSTTQMQRRTINTHTTSLCTSAGQFQSREHSLYPFPPLDLLVCQHHTWMHSGRHFCSFQSDEKFSVLQSK